MTAGQGGTVDAFDEAMHEALAARDRIISSLTHDVETLVTALAVHEGRDAHVTALAHLGRPIIPPWGGQEG